MMPFLLNRFCFYSFDCFSFFCLVGCFYIWLLFFFFFVEKYPSWKSSLGHAPGLCKLHMMHPHGHNSLNSYFLKLLPTPLVNASWSLSDITGSILFLAMPVELQGCWEIPCMKWSALLLEPSLQCLYHWHGTNRKKILIKPLLSKAFDFFFYSQPFPSFVVYYFHHYPTAPEELGLWCL